MSGGRRGCWSSTRRAVRVPAGFQNRHGRPLPLIVRKSDGGYGYPATDLACIRDRTLRRKATTLIYVVGAEQSLHFRLVFAVAGLAGYLPDTVDGGACGVRAHSRHGRQEAGQPFGRARAADRPADRSGGSRRGLDRPRDPVISARPSGPRWHSPWASAPSSTPTCPPSGCATTSSTGTACSPSRVTPAHTCSTPTPVSAPSSGGAKCAPGAGHAPAVSEPPERALALHLLGFAGGRRRHGRGVQPGQALHVPLCAGHHLHHLLRGLPGAGRSRGDPDVPLGPVRPDGAGPGLRVSPCWGWRHPTRCSPGPAALTWQRAEARPMASSRRIRAAPGQ